MKIHVNVKYQPVGGALTSPSALLEIPAAFVVSAIVVSGVLGIKLLGIPLLFPLLPLEAPPGPPPAMLLFF